MENTHMNPMSEVCSTAPRLMAWSRDRAPAVMAEKVFMNHMRSVLM